MTYNPDIHLRSSIRLQAYDYSQEGMYFITICCQGMVCRFGKIKDGEMMLNECGKIVDDEWQYVSIKYPQVALHEYIIMPNHFLAIIEIVGAGSARPDIVDTEMRAGKPRPYGDGIIVTQGQKRTATVGNIIGYFKYQTTKKIDLPMKLWQRNYYEHIIRNAKSYQEISNYIITNPIYWEKDIFYCQEEN